jgi:hypothetical protein
MIEPEHPEATCDDCGGHNVVWFAPAPVWNQVVREPLAEPSTDPMLCPSCFMLRADKVLGVKTWMVIPK